MQIVTVIGIDAHTHIHAAASLDAQGRPPGELTVGPPSAGSSGSCSENSTVRRSSSTALADSRLRDSVARYTGPPSGHWQVPARSRVAVAKRKRTQVTEHDPVARLQRRMPAIRMQLLGFR